VRSRLEFLRELISIRIAGLVSTGVKVVRSEVIDLPPCAAPLIKANFKEAILPDDRGGGRGRYDYAGQRMVPELCTDW
jgi:hypothetical protein